METGQFWEKTQSNNKQILDEKKWCRGRELTNSSGMNLDAHSAPEGGTPWMVFISSHGSAALIDMYLMVFE